MSSDSNSKVNWLEEMIELYSEGRSDLEVCKRLGITRQYFEKLMTESPKFRNYVEVGRDYAQAWWEEQGREGTKEKGTRDAAFWQFNMQNRYNWTNKTDTRQANIDVNQLDLDKMRQIVAKTLPHLLSDPNLKLLMDAQEDGEGHQKESQPIEEAPGED